MTYPGNDQTRGFTTAGSDTDYSQVSLPDCTKWPHVLRRFPLPTASNALLILSSTWCPVLELYRFTRQRDPFLSKLRGTTVRQQQQKTFGLGARKTIMFICVPTTWLQSPVVTSFFFTGSLLNKTVFDRVGSNSKRGVRLAPQSRSRPLTTGFLPILPT